MKTSLHLSNLSIILFFLLLISLPTTSAYKKPTSTYQKPEVLAKECLMSIAAIDDFASELQNQKGERQCIGCFPVQRACPADPDCQSAIDTLYRTCEGVTLPDGYYFDPQWSITGTWGADVKQELRVQIGRCGCSGGVRKYVSWSVLILAVGVASFGMSV